MVPVAVTELVQLPRVCKHNVSVKLVSAGTDSETALAWVAVDRVTVLRLVALARTSCPVEVPATPSVSVPCTPKVPWTVVAEVDEPIVVVAVPVVLIVVAPTSVVIPFEVNPPLKVVSPVTPRVPPTVALLVTLSPVPAAENVDAPVKVLADVPD